MDLLQDLVEVHLERLDGLLPPSGLLLLLAPSLESGRLRSDLLVLGRRLGGRGGGLGNGLLGRHRGEIPVFEEVDLDGTSSKT